MIFQEINYEQLIKQINAENPQNQTELIVAIEKIVGAYKPEILQIIKELDQNLKTISKIPGPSWSSRSSPERTSFQKFREAYYHS